MWAPGKQKENAAKKSLICSSMDYNYNGLPTRPSPSEILLPACPVHLLTYLSTPYHDQTQKVAVTICDPRAVSGNSSIMDGRSY